MGIIHTDKRVIVTLEKNNEKNSNEQNSIRTWEIEKKQVN